MVGEMGQAEQGDSAATLRVWTLSYRSGVMERFTQGDRGSDLSQAASLALV